MKVSENVFAIFLKHFSENVFEMFLKHEIPSLIIELQDRHKSIKFLNIVEKKLHTNYKIYCINRYRHVNWF